LRIPFESKLETIFTPTAINYLPVPALIAFVVKASTFFITSNHIFFDHLLVTFNCPEHNTRTIFATLAFLADFVSRFLMKVEPLVS
jgi:hypothetical protein